MGGRDLTVSMESGNGRQKPQRREPASVLVLALGKDGAEPLRLARLLVASENPDGNEGLASRQDESVASEEEGLLVVPVARGDGSRRWVRMGLGQVASKLVG